MTPGDRDAVRPRRGYHSAVTWPARLALAASFAVPVAAVADPAPPGGPVTPSSREDRAESARRRGELESFQELLQGERARPSGARVRDVVGKDGQRLVLLVETTDGVVQRVDTFEPPLFVRTLFALVLDAQRRIRFAPIEPEEDGHRQAFELDAYLFDTEGRTVARDHTYGTSLDCADGRLHERRIVTAYRPTLRVISRTVEFANDFGPSPRAQGCALGEPRDSPADAPALLRAYRLESAARDAGVKLAAADAPPR